jgi:hypothetical protein
VASFHLIQPTRQTVTKVTIAEPALQRSLVPERMLKTNQLFQEY